MRWRNQVINGVLNDAMFAQNLKDGPKDIVRARYLDAFQFAPCELFPHIYIAPA